MKIIGAILDQQLTFQDHVSTVCSASFYHLRSFRHVRPALTQDIAKTLGSTVICAKLDYTNSIFRGTSSANIKRLQRVQNALVRIVLTAPSPSATKNLQRLHRLPVQYRICHKVSSLARRQSYTSTAPSYHYHIIECFILFTYSFVAFGWPSTVSYASFSPRFLPIEVSKSLDPQSGTIYHSH